MCISFPSGTIGVAVGTALLPVLSRQVRGGEAQLAVGTLNRAIEFALFLTLPATLALAVASFPIMFVLFGRGAFDAHSAHLSAQSLTAYAFGLPAYVLLKVLAPGFFARGDTSTPVKVGVATLVLNFVLNLILMGPLQHVGPPLATSIAAWFNAGCLGFLLLRRRLLQPDADLRRRLPRMAVASAGMAAAIWFAEDPIFAALGPHLRWLSLGAVVGLGLAAYFVAGQVTGAFDVRDAFSRLASRRKPRRPVPSPQ